MGWVALGPEPTYAFNATLVDADLARCVREVATERHNLRGRILATADLKGSGRTRNTLSGGGAIRLSDADVYQLPVMVSLLKILSIRPPDQNAFSDADHQLSNRGRAHLLGPDRFPRRRHQPARQGRDGFSIGDSAELLRLGGPRRLDIPVVNQVFRGASQQIMLIQCHGHVAESGMTRP